MCADGFVVPLVMRITGWQWDSQSMILRIHSSLCQRGYLLWIDTEMMKGSTLDSMSEAIEGSAVICYGVSLS